ncbi:acyl-CoA reductase, partial [Gammaproteobacteria bacterium]|nr:acyl-CoA reductase [Gammaproteobacteria bacterium]
MSRTLLSFARGRVNLPYDVTEIIDAWDHLRGAMIRNMPEVFSRDEWAYMITFLQPDQLWQVFEQAFGVRCEAVDSGTRLYYPRGSVAIWLPNNVSLLGPLVMILLSLTGNKLRFKAGSRSEDLCGAFIEYVKGIESATVLHSYFADYVKRGVFDQHDDRNAEMAREAQVRIVFGGDT